MTTNKSVKTVAKPLNSKVIIDNNSIQNVRAQVRNIIVKRYGKGLKKTGAAI
jgi:hypothetical protein